MLVLATLVAVGKHHRQRRVAYLDGPGLGQVAARSGRFAGVAVRSDLLSDKGYRGTVAEAFGAVTPENELKWESVEPTRGHFTFGPADKVVDFARAHGMAVRGHTLVWHNQTPQWVQALKGPALEAAMREHITTVMHHYRGRIHEWDVVNEAVGNARGLRQDFWLKGLGPGYIAQAFRIAHQADPSAELFYNDYGAEGAGPKADAVYGLLKFLKAHGVPVDGIGLQGHVSTEQVPDLEANLKRFADLGMDIVLTEVDVRVPANASQADLERQARAYARLGRACVAVPRCRGIVVWGLDDADSWVPEAYPGTGHATLFTNALHPKPAWYALRDTLASAARR